jgi:hypothetical protein
LRIQADVLPAASQASGIEEPLLRVRHREAQRRQHQHPARLQGVNCVALQDRGERTLPVGDRQRLQDLVRGHAWFRATPGLLPLWPDLIRPSCLISGVSPIHFRHGWT